MALTLNILGGEKRQQPAPVTLPTLEITDIDDDDNGIALA